MKQPSGFIARCQCGVVVGALDAKRTERNDMGKTLGRWLFEGCTVEPRFGDSWSVLVDGCKCKSEQQPSAEGDGNE